MQHSADLEFVEHCTNLKTPFIVVSLFGGHGNFATNLALNGGVCAIVDNCWHGSCDLAKQTVCNDINVAPSRSRRTFHVAPGPASAEHLPAALFPVPSDLTPSCMDFQTFANVTKLWFENTTSSIGNA